MHSIIIDDFCERHERSIPQGDDGEVTVLANEDLATPCPRAQTSTNTPRAQGERHGYIVMANRC